jgi:hypothetical protein
MMREPSLNTIAPHSGHSKESFAPHSRQNLFISGFSVWHSGHSI